MKTAKCARCKKNTGIADLGGKIYCKKCGGNDPFTEFFRIHEEGQKRKSSITKKKERKQRMRKNFNFGFDV